MYLCLELRGRRLEVGFRKIDPPDDRTPSPEHTNYPMTAYPDPQDVPLGFVITAHRRSPSDGS